MVQVLTLGLGSAQNSGDRAMVKHFVLPHTVGTERWGCLQAQDVTVGPLTRPSQTSHLGHSNHSQVTMRG